jgi:hypothetical protein
MAAYRVTRLPAEPIDAAAAFYADHAANVKGAIQWARSDSLEAPAPDSIVVVFPAADQTHRGWRLAAVQALAREYAPIRVNALASDSEAAITAGLVFLESAQGVTGQLLELDDTGAGEVVSSPA